MFSDEPLPGSFVRVSRQRLLWICIFLAGMTLAAIYFFIAIDTEIFFSGNSIAMKIGGTVIRLDQLRTLKILAGPAAQAMSEEQFVGEISEDILLAEAGRRMQLDREPAFREKVRIFDRALPSPITPGEAGCGLRAAPASDPQDLTRALFLVEELARMTRDAVIVKNVAGSPIPADETPSTALSEDASRQKLRLRTILVPNEASCTRVLIEAALRKPFHLLNDLWSSSPYAGVQGDLGWVGRSNFPEKVFERLQQTPVGSLTRGFADEAGVHLFYVESRPESNPELLGRTITSQRRNTLNEVEIRRFIERQTREIPFWINPRFKRKER